jgi:hypothetical protein
VRSCLLVISWCLAIFGGAWVGAQDDQRLFAVFVAVGGCIAVIAWRARWGFLIPMTIIGAVVSVIASQGTIVFSSVESAWITYGRPVGGAIIGAGLGAILDRKLVTR